jgi:hypothetical protein
MHFERGRTNSLSKTHHANGNAVCTEQTKMVRINEIADDALYKAKSKKKSCGILYFST